MIKAEIEKALDIWIPSGDHLADESYRQGLITRYLEGKKAIAQFLNLEIHYSEFLDRMEWSGVDIDSYYDDIADNLPDLI